MFYDKFKLLCDQNGISCNKAATDIGLSNSTPTKWKKTGATPDSSTLAKISYYFNVPISYLLGITTDPNDRSKTHWAEIVYKNENVPTTVSDGEHKITDADIKAAFFKGADDLSKEEMDAMWDDAKAFIQFKMEQRKRSKNE
ncbi:MAG: helix-turn-helix transcriptional regulator [Clostridiales bacterium]|nr:helix-turn-helix transcriptional regulator [Clostridiales bacterium]